MGAVWSSPLICIAQVGVGLTSDCHRPPTSSYALDDEGAGVGFWCQQPRNIARWRRTGYDSVTGFACMNEVCTSLACRGEQKKVCKMVPSLSRLPAGRSVNSHVRPLRGGLVRSMGEKVHSSVLFCAVIGSTAMNKIAADEKKAPLRDANNKRSDHRPPRCAKALPQRREDNEPLVILNC